MSRAGPAQRGLPRHPPPPPRPRDAALLWLVRQPDPGHASTLGAGTVRGRGLRRHRRPGRWVPPRGPVPLGGTAPPDCRGRPAHLPPVPGTDADPHRHHRSRRDHPDPRAAGPGPGLTPAVAESAAATTVPHADRGRSPPAVVPGPWARGPVACPGVQEMAARRPPPAWPACARTAPAPGTIDLPRGDASGRPAQRARTFGGRKEIPIPCELLPRFEPVDQETRCRRVVRHLRVTIAGRAFRRAPRQSRSAPADPVDLAGYRWLRQCAGLVHRELDAQRAAVDRQDRGGSWCHESQPTPGRLTAIKNGVWRPFRQYARMRPRGSWWRFLWERAIYAANSPT